MLLVYSVTWRGSITENSTHDSKINKKGLFQVSNGPSVRSGWDTKADLETQPWDTLVKGVLRGFTQIFSAAWQKRGIQITQHNQHPHLCYRNMSSQDISGVDGTRCYLCTVLWLLSRDTEFILFPLSPPELPRFMDMTARPAQGQGTLLPSTRWFCVLEWILCLCKW